MDDRTLGETHALQESADAGSDLDRIDGLEMAGELVVVGDDALDCRRDRNLRRLL
jgi:hypothetical protein